MIDVKGMTLVYRSGKGVFDLHFSVQPGQVMGYLGPNGAGKTTTIRGLLGFMKPDKGECTLFGMDCFEKAPEIQKRLGYIPGEIAFFDGMNGDEFLRFMHKMRGTKNLSMQNRLLERMELNPKGRIKKFSKGMKQKLGIVAAFMHNPDVLILDEPTSGLDPLMQARFIELLTEEKKNGKTILMSSHMFEEVEKTCDHVLIIKDGRIIEQSDVKALKRSQRKAFILRTPESERALEALNQAGFQAAKAGENTLSIAVPGDGIDRFLKVAAGFAVMDFDVKAQTLEDIFMHFYGKEGTTHES